MLVYGQHQPVHHVLPDPLILSIHKHGKLKDLMLREETECDGSNPSSWSMIIAMIPQGLMDVFLQNVGVQGFFRTSNGSSLFEIKFFIHFVQNSYAIHYSFQELE